MAQISIVSRDVAGFGEQFKVEIQISPVEPVSGMQFSLYFDPMVLQAISVAQGNFMPSTSSTFFPGIIDNKAGRILGVYGATLWPDSSVSATGTFAIVVFKAAPMAGKTHLTLDDVVLGSKTGTPLPFQKVEQDIAVANLVEQLNGTTWAIKSPDGYRAAEIGDILSADFKPHFKLNAWSNECALDLDLATTEKLTPTVDNSKITWRGAKYGAEFLLGTDGFKLNVILYSRPTTNVFPLSFQPSNVTYHYQKPLTLKHTQADFDHLGVKVAITDTEVRATTSNPDLDIKVGSRLAYRPEKVVGSYAILHASKSKLLPAGQGQKYRGGKVGHWLRPLIYDSAGHFTWGVLGFSAGQRTVTVERTFLDNAVYPVTIDDEFGYHGTGATNTAIFANGTMFISGSGTFSPAGNGTLTNIYVYAGDSGKAVRGFIFDAAGNYIDQSANDITTAGGAWEGGAVVVGASIFSATAYVIGCHFGGSSMNHWYDDVGGGVRIRYAGSAFADALPNPVSWTNYSTEKDEIYAYAEYTPAAGGLSIPVAMHHRRQMSN